MPRLEERTRAGPKGAVPAVAAKPVPAADRGEEGDEKEATLAKRDDELLAAFSSSTRVRVSPPGMTSSTALYPLNDRFVGIAQALMLAGPEGISMAPSTRPPALFRPKSNWRRKTSLSFRRTITYPSGAGLWKTIRIRETPGVGVAGFGGSTGHDLHFANRRRNGRRLLLLRELGRGLLLRRGLLGLCRLHGIPDRKRVGVLGLEEEDGGELVEGVVELARFGGLAGRGEPRLDLSADLLSRLRRPRLLLGASQRPRGRRPSRACGG